MDDMDLAIGSILEFGGNLFTNGTFDVIRPAYSSATTLGSTIISKRSARVEQVSTAYAEPRIQGIENYGFYGKKDDLKVGDIIVPNQAVSSSCPIVTLFTVDRKRETVAFRSNKVGQLMTSKDKVKYSNVRFDFFSSVTPDSPLNPEMEGSMPHQRKRVCLINRAGLEIGWRLMTIVDGVNHYYLITSISGTGAVAILDLLEGKI